MRLTKAVRQHIRGVAASGGRARAKKYDRKQIIEWGKRGGRPRIHQQFTINITIVAGEVSKTCYGESAAAGYISAIRKRLGSLVADVKIEQLPASTLRRGRPRKDLTVAVGGENERSE